MVTIEAVPGRGPLAIAHVWILEGVAVALAVGRSPDFIAIVAASNAIRAAQLATPSAYAKVKVMYGVWIPAKLAAVGEVHFSLPRGPGSEALQRRGDVIGLLGHLYVTLTAEVRSQPALPASLRCLVSYIR